MWKSNPKLKHGSGLFLVLDSANIYTIEPRNVTWNLKKKVLEKDNSLFGKFHSGWVQKNNFPAFSQQK